MADVVICVDSTASWLHNVQISVSSVSLSDLYSDSVRSSSVPICCQSVLVEIALQISLQTQSIIIYVGSLRIPCKS